jgi:hypothetical protein
LIGFSRVPCMDAMGGRNVSYTLLGAGFVYPGIALMRARPR